MAADAVVGLALFGGDYGLIYWAEQYIDSGLTAILFATLPLVTLAVGAPLCARRAHYAPPKLAGKLVAVHRGRHLCSRDACASTPSRPFPCWPSSPRACARRSPASPRKRHGHALHPAALNAPAMLIGARSSRGRLGAQWGRRRLPRDAGTWAAIGYLAIAGSVITFLIYFSLLKTWSVTSLSFISVFTPAVALLLGFVFRAERLSGLMALGTILILGGVALGLSKDRR